MISDSLLAILEKSGSADVTNLVAEIRAERESHGLTHLAKEAAIHRAEEVEKELESYREAMAALKDWWEIAKLPGNRPNSHELGEAELFAAAWALFDPKNAPTPPPPPPKKTAR